MCTCTFLFYDLLHIFLTQNCDLLYRNQLETIRKIYFEFCPNHTDSVFDLVSFPFTYFLQDRPNVFNQAAIRATYRQTWSDKTNENKNIVSPKLISAITGYAIQVSPA